MTDLHPYKQEYLEAPIRIHKTKLECLQKRMALMPEGTTEYEKNEVMLEKIKTSGEIKALSNIIAEREGYYINFWQNKFLPEINEMEENFGDVIAKAQKSTDIAVKDLLAKTIFEVKGSVNVELKVYLYQQLKNLLKEPEQKVTAYVTLPNLYNVPPTCTIL